MPRGFEWEKINTSTPAPNVSEDSSEDIWMINGKYTGEVNQFIVYTDADELILDTNKIETTEAAYIEINATIKVEDETRAKAGDVVAKIGGKSDVTPATIVVGVYGDFDVEVSAADPTTVYAGMLEQEIADITLKEVIGDSLIGGRSVQLTLPEWAKWGAIEGNNDGKKAGLKDPTFPGKDGQVAKFEVDPELKADGAAKIKLEDMEVALSPDAPEGDLEIEISGSAGVKATVKVAEVKKPVAVEVASSPVIGIGKADQAIGEITITEAVGGLIKVGKTLGIELPKDVDWEDYDVEVTEGDLEIGRVTDKDHMLYIKIDRESDEASTIKVTGSVTAYRSVPEGKVGAGIGGTAVIPVNDVDELEEVYSVSYSAEDDITIGSEVAIAYKDWEDGLWADDDTVAKVEVANVGTPAPGEQAITAVFTLGSTSFTLNGVEQAMDVAPYAKDGRTYLPMRYVAQALGIKSSGILWKNGTATFISADRVVSVTIGSQIMNINGAPVTIDAAPEIVSGRTMLPIRWIAAAFGVDVNWNAETQEVTVN